MTTYDIYTVTTEKPFDNEVGASMARWRRIPSPGDGIVSTWERGMRDDASRDGAASDGLARPTSREVEGTQLASAR